MTEEQRKTKFNVMKALSILCLVVVIISGFLPWVEVKDGYELEALDSYKEIIDSASEEDIDELQRFFDEEDIDLEVDDLLDSIDGIFDPVYDGNVAPIDFLLLNNNLDELVGYMRIIEEADAEGISFSIGETEEEAFDTLSMIFLASAAGFGVLALVALIRIILRIFNRRGLGVGVVILSAINVAYMFLVAVIFGLLVGMGETDMFTNTSLTLVPLVVFVCSILGCVFWAQARKLINPVVVKEVVEEVVEVPVEQSVPVQAEETVEEKVEE